MKRMFGPKAQFGNLVKNSTDLKLSEVFHKAAFELGVNGTVPIVETSELKIFFKECLQGD